MEKMCCLIKKNCDYEGMCKIRFISLTYFDVYYCEHLIDHRMATGVAINRKSGDRTEVIINTLSNTIMKWGK